MAATNGLQQFAQYGSNDLGRRLVTDDDDLRPAVDDPGARFGLNPLAQFAVPAEEFYGFVRTV
jgi:hypothetical protein